MQNDRKGSFVYWIVFALIAVMTMPINAKEISEPTVESALVYEKESLVPLSEEDYFSSTHNAPCGGTVTVTLRVRITPQDRIELLGIADISTGASRTDSYYVCFRPSVYSITRKTPTSCTIHFRGDEMRASLEAPNEWWVHQSGVDFSVTINYPSL